jgi:hypothetical protein
MDGHANHFRRPSRRAVLSASAAFLASGCATTRRPTAVAQPEPPTPVTPDRLHRVTTAVPFPRGLVLIDGTLYVLARGRSREAGGADSTVDDRAGTIWAVDPAVTVPAAGRADGRLLEKARLYAAPTEPPFRLLDRALADPALDRETDRPYCALRFDSRTQNFFLCAFSGVDRADYDSPAGASRASAFSKNATDALFRLDRRTRAWHVVERHDASRGDAYPHHDTATHPPPHGWLKGPDNCLVVGSWLYAVAKDNNRLARYDLSDLPGNPAAPPPASQVVLGDAVRVSTRSTGLRTPGNLPLLGHSALAERDGWLYLATRTNSLIVRIPLDRSGLTPRRIEAELVARFDPFDPLSRRSANLTDIAFGPDGSLYVVSAQPLRVFRFFPDPSRPLDAREGRTPPWADLAAWTGNPRMKGENVLVDPAGRVFVASGDAYAAGPLAGTVYRIDPA